MQDYEVQRLQFHNLLHRPREDLITMNLRMRNHILNFGYYNELWDYEISDGR